MPSATTAESSDSMAPSIAMAKAGPDSSRNSASESPSALPSGPAISQGKSGSGAERGIPAWVTPPTT